MATLYGLRVRAADGSIMIDPTIRSGRILGYVDVSSDGALSHSGFAQGTPFYFSIPLTPSTTLQGSGIVYCYCNFSGSVMSWTYTVNSSISNKGPCRIFYGVY